MKYSAVLLFAVGVFAIPQDASITSAPASAPSAVLTPQQSCAVACPEGDVTCQAACVGVARPNSSQAVETTECAAECDQGDGSPEATQRYSDCVQSCIAKLFPSSQTVNVPGGAAASNAASNAASGTGSGAAATGSAAASNGASGSSGASGSAGTATGSGAESTGSATGSAAGADSTGAANSNSVTLVGAGLAGLMAVFAL